MLFFTGSNPQQYYIVSLVVKELVSLIIIFLLQLFQIELLGNVDDLKKQEDALVKKNEEWSEKMKQQEIEIEQMKSEIEMVRTFSTE